MLYLCILAQLLFLELLICGLLICYTPLSMTALLRDKLFYVVRFTTVDLYLPDVLCILFVYITSFQLKYLTSIIMKINSYCSILQTFPWGHSLVWLKSICVSFLL